MLRWRRFLSRLFVGGITASGAVTSSLAQDPMVETPPTRPSGAFYAPLHAFGNLRLPGTDDFESGIRLVQNIEAVSPQQSLSGQSAMSNQAEGIASQLQAAARDPGPSDTALATSVVSIQNTDFPATDAGSLVGNSDGGLGVGIQRRSPIVTDTRTRGATVGKSFASGSFWVPARIDLDTMLSKLDSRTVEKIAVIKGPYSALYGPGFNFFDVRLNPAPRYEDGWEFHSTTIMQYQTNGQQVHGREILQGGNADWGFRIGYGHRTGNDYRAGDGRDIPASYNSRDIDLALGLDLSANSRLDFNLLRLDQTGVEFPGQIFDIDFLITEGYELRYQSRGQSWFDRLEAEIYYNRTRFAGNAQRSGKRRQIPELDFPRQFVGVTDVDSLSAGGSLALIWGKPEEGELKVGLDLRHLRQRLEEFDDFNIVALDANGNVTNTILARIGGNVPIPQAHWYNPGLFAQYTRPLGERWQITTGGRVDYAGSDASAFVAGSNVDPGVPPPENLQNFVGGIFDNTFFLGSGFLTAEYELDDHWTLTGGAGYAMRPPTLTDMYATGPFLAILQNGFNIVIGNPNLGPERIWQFDLGVKGKFDRFRMGVNAYHAFIQDYIAFESLGNVLAVPNSVGVTLVNSPLATLSGAELFGEMDAANWLTFFANMAYTDGRDHTRSERSRVPGLVPNRSAFSFSLAEPLPAIAPLETRLGFRLHEPGTTPRWQVEFTARVVDRQERVATSLLEQTTAGFTTYSLTGFWKMTEHTTLTAGLENLTDKHYREHLDLRTGSGVFQPGFNFYSGVEVNY